MKEDAIRYTLSNLIYRKVVSSGKDSTLSNNWTLSRAEQEANMAYQIQPYTLYLVQKGTAYMRATNMLKPTKVLSRHAKIRTLRLLRHSFCS